MEIDRIDRSVFLTYGREYLFLKYEKKIFGLNEVYVRISGNHVHLTLGKENISESVVIEEDFNQFTLVKKIFEVLEDRGLLN